MTTYEVHNSVGGVQVFRDVPADIIEKLCAQHPEQADSFRADTADRARSFLTASRGLARTDYTRPPITWWAVKRTAGGTVKMNSTVERMPW